MRTFSISIFRNDCIALEPNAWNIVEAAIITFNMRRINKLVTWTPFTNMVKTRWEHGQVITAIATHRTQLLIFDLP